MAVFERFVVRSDHRFKWAVAPLAVGLLVVLAGCTPQQLNGWMPGSPNSDQPGVTNHSDTIATFWTNSWLILMGVGLLVWTLILWATIAYRRRKGEKGLPHQLRYHMPIEILFTIVPIILVGGFFAFTAREQAKVEHNFAAEDVDVHIEVYGKQWAWDFNYLEVPGSEYPGGVYSQGVQAVPAEGPTNGEIAYDRLPVLYVPVGANVQLDLKSRDVAHSFWVIDFLYKEDTIPGQTNVMSFVPEREGVYIGKCAELCGEYHSMMLFELHVVSQAEYDAYIQSLEEAGQTGARGDDYNRNTNLQGTAVPTFEPAEQH